MFFFFQFDIDNSHVIKAKDLPQLRLLRELLVYWA